MSAQDTSYAIIDTKEGIPSIVVNINGKEMPLHSRFYPTKEAETYKDFFKPQRFNVLIVLGVGLGYHLLHLKENIENYSLIILIEQLHGISEHIRNNDSTSFLLKSKNVHVIEGVSLDYMEKVITDLFSHVSLKGFQVLDHPSSFRVFEDYYTTIRNNIEFIINKEIGNSATKKAFGYIFFRNIIKNLSNSKSWLSVKNIFQSFDNYPVLVVTSGPSLEGYIDFIYKNQYKFFIIAIDSALPVLDKFFISADFVVSIDPQHYLCEHYVNLPLKDTVPVFSISVAPLLFTQFSGLLATNSHPIAQVIDELFPDSIGSIDSGTGSVAGDALLLAIKMNFKSIGLIGFDFCFTDYKIYSRGTAYQKRFALYFQNRLKTVECYNSEYIFKSSKSYRVSNRFSRKSFMQYKESLEQCIKDHEGGIIYNINSTGLAIRGIDNISEDDFERLFCSDDYDKKNIIRTIIADSNQDEISHIQKKTFSVLREEGVFNKIIDASLPESVAAERRHKLFSLIHHTG